jgi:hypothetical protein
MKKSCEEKNPILDGGTVGSLQPLQMRHFAGRCRPSFFSLYATLHKIQSPKFSNSFAKNQLRKNLQSGLLDISESRRAVNSLSGIFSFKAKEGDSKWEFIPRSTNSRTSSSICNSIQHTLSSVSSHEIAKEPRNILKDVSRIIICSIFFTAVLLTSFIRPSFALTEVSSTSYKAVNAILGEAEGEPFLGKVALGEALRTRLKIYGDFRGVYGLSSTRLSKASARARAECLRAWRESGASSLVADCDVWGTDSDIKKFKKTRWFKSYEFVRKIGNHSFFRLKKGGAK